MRMGGKINERPFVCAFSGTNYLFCFQAVAFHTPRLRGRGLGGVFCLTLASMNLVDLLNGRPNRRNRKIGIVEVSGMRFPKIRQSVIISEKEKAVCSNIRNPKFAMRNYETNCPVCNLYC